MSETMRIGETVIFTGIYEGDESKPYPTTGTVTDIRNGFAFVFSLGQRWPFVIALADATRRGYYPPTAPPTRQPKHEHRGKQ
jgi:hypothetical protein